MPKAASTRSKGKDSKPVKGKKKGDDNGSSAETEKEEKKKRKKRARVKKGLPLDTPDPLLPSGPPRPP